MKNKTKNIIATILLIFFVTLIVLGIISKESETVFRHAVKVCLECIGIG